jgi:HSP20 family protein
MTTLIKRRENGNGFPALRSNLSDFFDLDNFFDELSLPRPLLSDGMRFNRLPATNIRETEKEFIVEMAVPGLKKEDFVVDVDNGSLEIRVEKEEKSEDKKEKFTRREYNYSAFYRSFNLPETVIAEKIKAEYKDGILKVQIPKAVEEKRKPAKKISVV